MTCFVLRLPPHFEEEPSEASHLSKLREIGIAVSDLVVACTVVPETDRDRSGIVCTAYQKSAVNLQPKAQALKSKPSDLEAVPASVRVESPNLATLNTTSPGMSEL